eukprot:GHVP01058054.1.p1 GENE.GHVP01058054.1~~GHVP01058054.1.p1  ORF type:complete len:146 (+),score=16.65 GHVP01058054.1:994-1431(+)
MIDRMTVYTKEKKAFTIYGKLSIISGLIISTTEAKGLKPLAVSADKTGTVLKFKDVSEFNINEIKDIYSKLMISLLRSQKSLLKGIPVQEQKLMSSLTDKHGQQTEGFGIRIMTQNYQKNETPDTWIFKRFIELSQVTGKNGHIN